MLWLEEGKKVDERNIVAGPRINIDYAQEWKGASQQPFSPPETPKLTKPAHLSRQASEVPRLGQSTRQQTGVPERRKESVNVILWVVPAEGEN